MFVPYLPDYLPDYYIGFLAYENNWKKIIQHFTKNEYNIEVDSDCTDAIGLARYGCYFLNQSK